MKKLIFIKGDSMIMKIAYLIFQLKWKFRHRKWKNNDHKRKAFNLACATWCSKWYRNRYGHEVTKLWL